MIRRCQFARSCAVFKPKATLDRLGSLFWLGFSISMAASAQSDAELFTQGRIALDNYKDCAGAEKAFLSESAQAQNDPIWLSYMGQTEECLGKLRNALAYYDSYNRALPGKAEIINKIGDLRYRISKADEQRQYEEQRAQQQRLFEQDQADLKRRREEVAAQQHDALRADALRTLDPDMKKLVSLMNSRSFSKGYVTKEKTFTPEGCKLEIERRYGGSGGFGHDFTTIDFSLATPVPEDAGVECRAGSNCISVVDKSNEHVFGISVYRADSTPQSLFRYSWSRFSNQSDENEAIRLIKRIAAACEKP